MRAGGKSLGAACGLLVFLAILPPGVAESVAELQARFDRETSGVHKAKLMAPAAGDSGTRRHIAGIAGSIQAAAATRPAGFDWPG